MLRQTFLTLANSNELKNVALHNRAARSLARRFVAGETLSQAVSVIHALNAKGIKATFDHLGENVTTPDDAKAAADSYIDILNAIANAQLASNVSLKLTQMGMDLSALRTTAGVLSTAQPQTPSPSARRARRSSAATSRVGTGCCC